MPPLQPITSRTTTSSSITASNSAGSAPSPVSQHFVGVQNDLVGGDWHGPSDDERVIEPFSRKTRTAEDIYRELYPGTTEADARIFFDQYQSTSGKRKRDFDLGLAQQMEQELKVPDLAKKPRLALSPGGGGSVESGFHTFVVPTKFRESIGAPLVYGKTPGDLPFDEFSVLLELKTKLFAHAKHFFQTATLPEKPVMPVLDRASRLEDNIAAIYSCSRGLVIQDGGADIGNKRLLVNYMGTLAGQGVKTLYMENLLTDFHQDDLDNFSETGEMPEALNLYLDALDIHALGDHNKSGQGQNYSYCGLVEAAHQHGIKIKAIDAVATLYFSEDTPLIE